MDDPAKETLRLMTTPGHRDAFAGTGISISMQRGFPNTTTKSCLQIKTSPVRSNGGNRNLKYSRCIHIVHDVVGSQDPIPHAESNDNTYQAEMDSTRVARYLALNH